ncbi:MAG: hypothetical protein ACRESZ_13915, partial [Methylococcales bacterium]
NEFPQEKGILFLHEKYADKLIAGFPLKAILIPKITQFEPMLRPTSAAHAMKALAPSTIFQLPDADPELVHWIARLVRQVPCYELNSGGVGQSTHLVEHLLDEL